jgi:hypothetical protein
MVGVGIAAVSERGDHGDFGFGGSTLSIFFLTHLLGWAVQNCKVAASAGGDMRTTVLFLIGVTALGLGKDFSKIVSLAYKHAAVATRRAARHTQRLDRAVCGELTAAALAAHAVRNMD